MKRSMQEVTVETNDGMIFIKQPIPDDEGYEFIVLTCEQIPIICNWLEEAKKEICSGRLVKNNE